MIVDDVTGSRCVTHETRKVAMRDDFHYATSTAAGEEAGRKAKYDRQMEQLSRCGFYSHSSQPYRCIGGQLIVSDGDVILNGVTSDLRNEVSDMTSSKSGSVVDVVRLIGPFSDFSRGFVLGKEAQCRLTYQ